MDAKIKREPDYRSSAIRVAGEFDNGVKWNLNATAILAINGSKYYGRNDREWKEEIRWNEVSILPYWGEAFNFFGKGARSNETYDLAKEALSLLIEVSG